MQCDLTLVPESPLQKFLEESKEKSPLDRAKLFEATTALSDIHASVASQGQSSVPPTEFHVAQTYACFVVAPGMVGRASTSNGGAKSIVNMGQRIIELDAVS